LSLARSAAAGMVVLALTVSARANSGFWGPPENLGMPVNSSENELSAVVSPDGLNLYLARTVAGQNDLFVAPRDGATWGRPAALSALNSPLYNELNLTFSIDGARIYFTTDRPGGPGGFDIWTSAWSGTNWLPPEPLGPNVNTPDDEWYAAEGADGLYISARTASGLNRGDILFAAGTYPGFATRLPIPQLATPFREMSAYPGPDGKTLYLAADYPGSAGKDDLWLSVRNSESWEAPRALKCGLNDVDFDEYPTVGVTDRELIFASYGRKNGEGGSDLYWSKWHSLGDMNADGAATTGDIIHLVLYLFGKGAAPSDPLVEDLNCDEAVSLLDVVELINYVLRAGPPPCNSCTP